MDILSKYIVRVKNFNGFVFNDFCDGIVKILKNDNNHFFALYDSKEKEILKKNMTNENIHFSFKKNVTICQVIITTSDNIFGLEFDKNSFSSFNSFCKDINKIIKTKINELYYESGEIHFSGEMIDGKLNGQAFEFYKNGNIKYNGEFENNLYDGEGTFTSNDGFIKVNINNISSGKPIDWGLLVIQGENSVDIDFSLDKFIGLNLNSDDFCYNLAEIIYPNLKEKLFSKLDSNTKLDLIWNKLLDISNRISKLEKNNSNKSSFW